MVVENFTSKMYSQQLSSAVPLYLCCEYHNSNKVTNKILSFSKIPGGPVEGDGLEHVNNCILIF